MSEDYGTQLEDGSMRFVRKVPGPIERVWAYLVEPEKRVLWLCGGTSGQEAGDSFTLAFDNSKLGDGAESEEDAARHNPHQMTAELVTSEPPRVLAFRWNGAETRFELEEAGDTVKLTVIQSPPSELTQRIGMASGWHTHLGLLVTVLQDDPPRNFWPAFDAAKSHYEAVVL
jgi:uncharacterized protein YndB with AHSA1/START domain